MKEVKIVDILKELQEGVDFTIENKKKIIFHNEKIVDYLEWQGGEKAKWFYDCVKEIIFSPVVFYEEKKNGSYVFTFKSGNNKKDNNQEIEKDFKKNIDWDNYEEDFKKRFAKIDLEKTKSGSISYLESQGNHLSRKEIFHAHWETYLTSSDYWKNWREKINSFETEKEISFYTDRLRAFIEFVQENTLKEVRYISEKSPKQWDPTKTPQLLDQELKRLENISEEEFNQTDKWRKSGPIWKKLSTEEMLNDPWFSKQIDNIFGLKSEKENSPVKNQELEKAKIHKKTGERKEKLIEKDSDNGESKRDKKVESGYSWTQEQLITEINRLKAENKELENNQTLTNSEKENRIKQNQQALDKLESNMLNNSVSDTDSKNANGIGVKGWIGITGGVGLLGLVVAMVIKNKK